MLLVASLFSLFMLGNSGIVDCGKAPLFTITSQSFSPDSPTTGDNTTWEISFAVPDSVDVTNITSINSGIVNGFLPIDTTYTNMCNEVGCPTKPGDYSITNWQIWPDGLVGTKLALTTQWVDQNDNELLCSKVSIVGQT